MSSCGCGGRTCVIAIGSTTRVLVVLACSSPPIPLISEALSHANKLIIIPTPHRPRLPQTMNSLSTLPNESAYTLATVHPDSDEFSSLLSPSSHNATPPSYGSAPIHPPHNARRVVFNATCKMALIFALGCIFLGGTLWISLPTLDPYV